MKILFDSGDAVILPEWVAGAYSARVTSDQAYAPVLYAVEFSIAGKRFWSYFRRQDLKPVREVVA